MHEQFFNHAVIAPSGINMEKIISKDGTIIAFGRTGKGPALVLVDGAFCYSKYGVTPKLVPLLSDFFTVYYYDRRGRGESSDTKPYSVGKEVEDLLEVIVRTGEEPLICGFSSGSGLVLHAIAKGAKVKKVALFEPPYLATSSDDWDPPHDAEKKLNDLFVNGKRSDAVKYFMTEVMDVPGVFVFLLKQFGKSMWKENESTAGTLAYDVAIMGNYSVPAGITSRIDVPAIVIGGERSPQNLKRAVEMVAGSIPQGQIRWLKGQSHNASVKVLAPCLIDFFRTPNN